ncbi:hypothetical protein GmHk_12G034696 [Glycine max]|nr:hypothetical protein GmHk_12G034696 [Glycine max]
MLEIDLKALTNDKGSMEMIDITKRDGSVHLFVLHPVLKQAKNVQVPNNLVEGFSTCFVLIHVFWETSQKATHPITKLNQSRLTMKFLSDGLSKSRYILLVAFFETSKISSNCFQDQRLIPQTNIKLFNMFCPHPHAFWETSQKLYSHIPAQPLDPSYFSVIRSRFYMRTRFHLVYSDTICNILDFLLLNDFHTMILHAVTLHSTFLLVKTPH